MYRIANLFNDNIFTNCIHCQFHDKLISRIDIVVKSSSCFGCQW